MRKTLSRAKRILNGKWAEGSVAVVGGKTFIISDKAKLYVEPDGGWESIENLIEVDPETVGQWTELKDKEGVKIFEGNDVEYNDFTSVYKSKRRGKVVWHKACWCIHQPNNTYQRYIPLVCNEEECFAEKKLKVIHDAPALLEKSNG